MSHYPLPLPAEAGPVRLRRLRVADLSAFQAYRHDPLLGRFQGWEPQTDAQAREFLESVADAPGLEPGQWWQIAIARAADDTLIGDIGLHLAADAAQVEIGFTLAAAWQGQGLAQAAVGAAIDLMFRETPATRVVGITDARNAPSVRLMQRLGMGETAREEAVFRGERCVELTFVRRRLR